MLLVVIVTTLVSYWPSRKIAKNESYGSFKREVAMIRFLLKGLIRDRHRSLLPIIVTALGVMLTVVFHSWLTGVLGDSIEYNARFASGHVKAMTPAYRSNMQQMPNDLAIHGCRADDGLPPGSFSPSWIGSKGSISQD